MVPELDLSSMILQSITRRSDIIDLQTRKIAEQADEKWVEFLGESQVVNSLSIIFIKMRESGGKCFGRSPNWRCTDFLFSTSVIAFVLLGI